MSRGALRLSVGALPAVRDALAARARARLEERGDWGPVWRRLMERAWGAAESLSTAPLWWVSEGMGASACALARDDGWDAQAPPSTPSGFVCFARDLPGWVSEALPHPVRAMQWASAEGRRGGREALDVGVLLYTADRAACASAGGGVPLAVMDVDEASHASDRALRLLDAMWLLSSQAVGADRAGRAFPGGSGAGRGPDPMARTVKVMVLREMRSPSGGSGGPGRPPAHRYVVRGFWRHQPCGPMRSRRRLTWVGPYVRGPRGAPLVVRETVRVWRR